MKKILLYFLLLFPLFGYSQAQVKESPDQLICKKWFLEKYKEANEKTYPATSEMKKQYTLYKSDGTMESIEDGGVKINGKWELDEKTMTLTVTQTQNKNYPQKIVSKIIKLNYSQFVIQSKDAGGSLLTLFMTSTIPR